MKGWKSSDDSQIAGYYDLGETIGRGHFAVVKRAKHVFTGEVVATKVIDKVKLDSVARQHLYHEVRCMKLVQHPYVIRLYEVIDTKNKLYLIQEFGDGGDLFDHVMKKDSGLDDAVAKKYFRQIVSAVAYCHRLHVVHRDLKPENVIFFPKLDVVKVTDFGFSNSFIPGDKLNTACGSLAYSAPEVLLGDAYDAVASDIWSLGVILYMLIVGRLPFSEANDSETLTKIMDCHYKIPNNVSPECQNLIKKLLVKEPQDRYPVDKILNHEWLKQENPVSIISVHPLLSRSELSEDEREHVIDIMVSGNVATREEILKSLEDKHYDHIEATFYLLAERHLNAMLAQQIGYLGRPAKSGHRGLSAAASVGSTHSSLGRPPSTSIGRPPSGDSLIDKDDNAFFRNAEPSSSVSEAMFLEAKDENDKERATDLAHQISVLIEEPYEDPDELPQIYEIRKGVDDLEVECRSRRASLTRLANIAELSESDEVMSSSRPSGRLSVSGIPSDSGPEHECGLGELGSPSGRPRSARSSWVCSRRGSGVQLRSGSVSNRPTSFSRLSAPGFYSPFSRLTRSASSSDTSDIESDSMSMSMSHTIAKMKRTSGIGQKSAKKSCFRCDLELPRAVAASLLKTDLPELHRRHKRPSHRRSGIESSDPGTTSASDTERDIRAFSAANSSRCQSAAGSVTFLLGAGANDTTSATENARRSSLPQVQASSLRACCKRVVESNFSPAVLEKVPFDQQHIPHSYRHALKLRLHYNRDRHRHNRFSTTSDAFLLPPSNAGSSGRHSAASSREKLRSRKSVPPRIEEVTLLSADGVDSPNGPCKKQGGSKQTSPDIEAQQQGVSDAGVGAAQVEAVSSDHPGHQREPVTSTVTSESTAVTGHASAPSTAVLSGAATSNRRHNHRHHHKCPLPNNNFELRPLHQIQMLKSHRTSEMSVSTLSRDTGSDGSLPASSAPSIRNGFKTPSVSSVRSDPDFFHYHHGLPVSHCGSTVSAVVGGSCRVSRTTSRNAAKDGSKSGDDREALLKHTPPPSRTDSEALSTCRCGTGSMRSRKRGGSASYRHHCQATHSVGRRRTPSIRSNHSSTIASAVVEENPGVGFQNGGLSGSSTPSRHKRNLLRSLFTQCFGCGHGANVANGKKSNRTCEKAKQRAALIKKTSRERLNSASSFHKSSSSRKKMDSSGLS